MPHDTKEQATDASFRERVSMHAFGDGLVVRTDADRAYLKAHGGHEYWPRIFDERAFYHFLFDAHASDEAGNTTMAAASFSSSSSTSTCASNGSRRQNEPSSRT